MASRRIDVPALLKLLGIVAVRRGRKWSAPCPFHGEREASWAIIDAPGDQKHGAHYCFGCKQGGGPWELAARVWKLGDSQGALKEAGKRLWLALNLGQHEGPVLMPRLVRVDSSKKKLGMQFPDGIVFPDRFDDWRSGVAREYVRNRAEPWQVEKWGIGYALWGDLAYRIVVPVVTSGVLVTFVARAFISSIPRYDSGSRRKGAIADRALFGEPELDRTDPTILVTEGVFKALAFERDGFSNVVALLGSELTSARALLLAPFTNILVATDPDAAGEKAWRQISGSLGRSAQRRVVRVVMQRAPDDATSEERVQAVNRARAGL